MLYQLSYAREASTLAVPRTGTRFDVSASAATVPSPREAVFALLGTFAEASTRVVERLADVGKEVEVSATTGMLEGDEGTGAFVPHGHTVRIRVVASELAAL